MMIDEPTDNTTDDTEINPGGPWKPTPGIRLDRDMRKAAATLSREEARFLVDAYYQMQRNRIRSGNQVAALAKSEEPHEVLQWFAEQDAALENHIKAALDKYSMAHPIGERMRGVVGVGPVIAAGLLAHIDIKQAPTVGHIWRFAGLDPTSEWKKGEKRPWNAGLKVVCWKLGESFVKVQGHEADVYGKVYVARKAYEIDKNARGDYADQAKAALEAKRYGKDTEAFKHYMAGHLPPARIHARAKRYAVKLFLADLHAIWYEHEFKTKPPLPYPIVKLGHAHIVDPTF